MSASQDTPQAGISPLGTASHAYLELDLHDGADPRELVVSLADLREPRTTIGGVNLVVLCGPSCRADRIGLCAPPVCTAFKYQISIVIILMIH